MIEPFPTNPEGRAPILRVQTPGRPSLESIELPVGFDQMVGRERPAEIVWPDPMISRRHLRLLHDERGVWVEDLGSTNGTYVNGEQVVVRQQLHDGDELRAGQSVATFVEVRPASTSSSDLTGPQAVPVSGGCPGCGTRNSAELWFCARCGREQRPIPVPLAYESTERVDVLRNRLLSPRGGLRRAAFRRAMRTGNGGHRVEYSEGLAISTILFRLLLLGLVCAALAALIALD